MSFIDTIIGKLVPHACLGCAREGSLLCRDCEQSLAAVNPVCFQCATPGVNGLICESCRLHNTLQAVHAVTVYEGVAKELVRHLKFAGAQAAARLMVRQMNAHLPDTPRDALVVVPVPTATSRVRERGYDQAKLLARELAWQRRLPYLDCLARSGQAHQVGSSRGARLSQIEGAYRVKKSRHLKGTTVLLVDDVMTTGATLTAAARVLQQSGASHVEAIVFARA